MEMKKKDIIKKELKEKYQKYLSEYVEKKDDIITVVMKKDNLNWDELYIEETPDITDDYEGDYFEIIS